MILSDLAWIAVLNKQKTKKKKSQKGWRRYLWCMNNNMTVDIGIITKMVI